MLKKLSASGFAEPFGPLVADPSVQVPAAVMRSSCPAVTFTPVFAQFLAATERDEHKRGARPLFSHCFPSPVQAPL
jgi:hypothetical protein